MIVEKNTKNGIAINRIINTETKGKQAAAARNSSCITLLQLTTRPKQATATYIDYSVYSSVHSITIAQHMLSYSLFRSPSHKNQEKLEQK